MPKLTRQYPHYSVNMYDHDLSEEGMHDFFWPVLHTEITDTATDFLYKSADYLTRFDDKDITAQIYKLTMNYFVNQFGGIFQACLVHKRFLDAGKIPVAPCDWLIYPYVFDGKAPTIPTLIEKLKSPQIKKNIFQRLSDPKRLIKILKKLSFNPKNISLDGLKIKNITNSVLDKDIIATQRTPLIIQHAGRIEDDVVFTNTHRWFQNISEEDFQIFLLRRDEQIEREILNIVKGIFIESNLDFFDFIETYLKKYLGDLYTALGVHYTRLLASDKLPKRLWTGTGGNIWDVTLRLAVLQKGGQVIGHDHGGGTSHANIPIIGNIELWACSEFITFNQHQANLIKKAMGTWPLLDNKPPMVTGIGYDMHDERKKNPVKTKNIKNIVVLSTLYDRDRGRNFAFYPDIIYTDWQARLMSKLKAWGYSVLFKPHPESQILPHPDLEKKVEIERIGGLFSDIKDRADLIIFDYTYTTVLLEALKTEIPILLLEFDNIPWHKGAKALLQRRCGFVEGKFDENNRVIINWESVRIEIDVAVEKRKDKSFIDKFYR